MFQVFKQLWLFMMWNTDDAENTFSDLIIKIIITNDFLFNITCAMYIFSQTSTCLGFRHRKFAFLFIHYHLYSLQSRVCFGWKVTEVERRLDPQNHWPWPWILEPNFHPKNACVWCFLSLFFLLFFWGGLIL